MQGGGLPAQAVAELCEAAGLWALVWWRCWGAVLPAVPSCESWLQTACAVLCAYLCAVLLPCGSHTQYVCCAVQRAVPPHGSHGNDKYAAACKALLSCVAMRSWATQVNTAHHSTAQHSTAEHSTAQHSTSCKDSVVPMLALLNLSLRTDAVHIIVHQHQIEASWSRNSKHTIYVMQLWCLVNCCVTRQPISKASPSSCVGFKGQQAAHRSWPSSIIQMLQSSVDSPLHHYIFTQL